MPDKKTKYYDMSIDEIDKIKKENKRPILGIHVCCGVCVTFPLEFLTPVFKVVILYCNSNIYPKEEYDRRLKEMVRYVERFNEVFNQDVEIVLFPYDNVAYNAFLAPYKDQPEGKDRCKLCYELRMNETYKYADEKGFDYFTTVMTISRQKNSRILNEIGEKLSKKYRPKYFYSDFKKKRGIDRSRELRIEHNLYNQEYCGCIYSYYNYLKK